MTSNITLIMALSLAGLASCASTRPTISNASYFDPQEAAEPSAPDYKSNAKWYAHDKSRVSLEFFREDIELDELEFDPDGGPDFDRSVDRERAGFRGAFGPTVARGYFQIFGEDFGENPLDYENVGMGGGVTGAPTVHEFENDLRLIVPYRLGLNVVFGDEESGPSQDLFYGEFESEVGVGTYLHGLQPSMGLYTSSIGGGVDVDSGPDVDFAGTNSGAFAQLFYKHDDFPMWGKLRLIGGNVEGVLVAVGATF